jgi:O-antigen/teichoic acid export membrane protein
LLLLGGEAFSKVCVLVAFGYLARVLSPGDYGLVELALSITVFFVLGVESGMGLYGARVVASAPDRAAALVPEVMVLRAMLSVPAFVAMLAAAAILQGVGLGFLAVNAVAVLLTPFLTQWVFQGLRQMQWVVAGTMARSLAFVLLVVVLVRPGADLRVVAAAEVGGLAMLGAVNWYILRRNLRLALAWRGVMAGARRLFDDVWFMGIGDFAWACLWYGPLLAIGWLNAGRPDQAAWLGSATRLVLALHTFVFLYFFNLLPNLARELAVGLDAWRDLVARSIRTAMWPACLVAVVGTLGAPALVPAVFGPAYEDAVVSFQIAVWIIPVAWLSGHHRFSLIAAGHQRTEVLVSLATASATLAAALTVGRRFGAAGGSAAVVAGGVVNLVLAVAAVNRRVGRVPFGREVAAIGAATAVSVLVGAGGAFYAGTIAGTLAGSALLAGAAIWQLSELRGLVRRGIDRGGRR